MNTYTFQKQDNSVAQNNAVIRERTLQGCCLSPTSAPVAKGHPWLVSDLVVRSLSCPAVRNNSFSLVFQDTDVFERRRPVVWQKVPLLGSPPTHPVLPHRWFQVLPCKNLCIAPSPGTWICSASGGRNSDRLVKVFPAGFTR